MKCKRKETKDNNKEKVEDRKRKETNKRWNKRKEKKEWWEQEPFHRECFYVTGTWFTDDGILIETQFTRRLQAGQHFIWYRSWQPSKDLEDDVNERWVQRCESIDGSG